MIRSFPEIESYLATYVGLDPDATPGMVGRAVERILAEKQISESSEYFQLLKSSKLELEYLLEQVLVPETWFYRYPDAYHYLKRWAGAQQNAPNRLRILSVPCSTGEEPYSIAMTLTDAGLPPEKFLIDAADVSSKALQKADEALYSQNSFRGSDLAYRERYFQKDSGLFRLNTNIRKLVKFFVWNVQEPLPKEAKSRYDVIFCRNLFIYFHHAAQRRMIATLKQLLDPHGLLFAGHAEAGPLLSPAFQSIPPMKAFVHCKQ